MKVRIGLVALTVAMVLGGCNKQDKPGATQAAASAGMPGQEPPPVASPASLEEAVAASWRSPENVASDVYRNPVHVMTFLGITKTSRVAGFGEGQTYYAEMLAPFLRESGSYVGVTDAGQDLQQKFERQPTVFKGATVLLMSNDGLALKTPVDVAIVSGSVDKWVAAGTAENMFKHIYSALRPGGVLGVVQHRANGEVMQDGKSGYLSEKQVVFLAELAGFQLVEWSEISSNPKDTKDYPEGAEVLPPTLKLGAVEREKYQTIGESDRMTLKFAKNAQ